MTRQTKITRKTVFPEKKFHFYKLIISKVDSTLLKLISFVLLLKLSVDR